MLKKERTNVTGKALCLYQRFKTNKEMTSKEFAFNYAGDEFMYDDDIVILVGYCSENSREVIVSPTERYGGGPWYWEPLDSTDVITYMTDIRKYQYANLNELIPIHREKPQAVAKVKPLAPGDCIAYCEGLQGMNYSVINGYVSAVYKRQGGTLKLVSWGDGINNVTERV